MPRRLVDAYRIEEVVQISFGDARWHDGVVIKLQHPGVWVRIGDQSVWFVTNGRRIRSGQSDGAPPTDAGVGKQDA